MYYKVNGGFSCDRQSKYDYTASTVSYIGELYKNQDVTIVFKEFDSEGNLVEFDSPDSSKTSRSDLVMYFNDICYVIELKERWKQYHSNYYGKDEDNEGWMLNIEKYKELKNADGIPLYINLYPDNVIRIWNLNKIDDYQTITKNIHKTTVLNSDIKRQDRYQVWNRDSIEIPRIKGNPSNGIWKS